MTKNKLMLVALVGALAVALGLSACGGSGSSSASASSASGSSAASSSASAAASSSAASSASAVASSSATPSASSSASALSSDYWAGTLEDGSTVDYFDDAQAMKPGLVILSADGTKGKAWVGSLDVGDDAKTLKITDDNTKETVTIIPGQNPAAGTMQWEIEGYGKVTLEKASEAQYQEHLAQVEKLA